MFTLGVDFRLEIVQMLVVNKYCLEREGGYPTILKHGIIGGYPRWKKIRGIRPP